MRTSIPTEASMNTQSDRNSDQPRQKNLRVLRQLFPYLRPYRAIVAGAGLALALTALIPLSIGYGLRAMIDQGFAASDPAMLDRSLLGLLGLIVVMAAATFARFSLVAWLGERIVADLRRAMYDHILRLSPAYFETARSGDILARITADTSVLQVVVGSSLSGGARNILILIGGTIMMMLTSAQLSGLMALMIPLIVVPIVFLGRRVRMLSRASQDKIADVNVYAEETIHGIRTVQAFGHELFDRLRFTAHVEGALSVAMRRIHARAWLTALVIFLVFSSIGIILWTGGHAVLRGELSAGQLVSFSFFSVLVAGAVGAVSELVGDLQRAAGATERIFDLLNVAPTVVAPLKPVPMPVPGRGEVQFENVTFRYPAQPDHPALHDINFAVKSGERVAIVGPSGAGKTTLFQLMLRFYDPQTGVIRLDGIDIRGAAFQDFRSHIGLVPQDPTIFSANAWHNIGYGREGASEDMIVAAAKAAHAHEFLEALPQGYDTFLGEKGVRLSGGQRQRIAIARAILRNPSLLLLDEATSALDAESERLVQDAFARLMQNRTTLVIAHRLATVVNADRILVLEQGKIVATGTHASLIAEGGLYARLAALQFDPNL